MRTPYNHNKPHLSLKNWANTSCPAAIRSVCDNTFHLAQLEVIVVICASLWKLRGECSRNPLSVRKFFVLWDLEDIYFCIFYVTKRFSFHRDSGGVDRVNPASLNLSLEALFNHSRTKTSSFALFMAYDEI